MTQEAAPAVAHVARETPLSDLKPHPQNYRQHPADQLAHLQQSIQEHGIYRNVITAVDGTILAGHGVVEAARASGLQSLPVVKLNLQPDDPRALKLLAGDNEVGHLAAVDDRALADLLRSIQEDDLVGLLGTGYDEAMLANLIFVTRPEHEIGDRDDAAQWVGLPGHDNPAESLWRVVVNCDTEEERQQVMQLLGLERAQLGNRGTLSVRWPPRPINDLASLNFTDTSSNGKAVENAA